MARPHFASPALRTALAAAAADSSLSATSSTPAACTMVKPSVGFQLAAWQTSPACRPLVRQSRAIQCNCSVGGANNTVQSPMQACFTMCSQQVPANSNGRLAYLCSVILVAAPHIFQCNLGPVPQLTDRQQPVQHTMVHLPAALHTARPLDLKVGRLVSANS